MSQLTDRQFRLMVPRLSSAKRAEILPCLNKALDQYEINSPSRIAAFISNLMHECRSFELTREGWGPTPAQRRYEPPYRKAAELGNTQKGDGFKFRGHGWIQTTGRANHKRVEDEINRIAARRGGDKVDLMSRPELLETPQYAAIGAGFFWKSNGLNRLADCLRGRHDANEQKTLTAICKRINGGTNGLSDRVRNYWRVLAVLQNEPFAQNVATSLDQLITENVPPPAIATPQTVALAEVTQQVKAARLIDIAERVPASAAQSAAKNIWQRAGARAGSLLITLIASLKAGELSAWLGLAIVVGFLIFLIWSQRHDLKRWKTLLMLKVTDAIKSDN